MTSMLEGRSWFAKEPASEEAIAKLESTAPKALPSSYLRLLRESNGGEGPLPVSPFNACLDPIEEVLNTISLDNSGRDGLAGYLIFGGNGGGEFLAFDTCGSEPWPIVAIDQVAGPDSAQQVATAFDEFVSMLGREG